MTTRKRAPRNRTLTLTADEADNYRERLLKLRCPTTLKRVVDRTICQDVLEARKSLPSAFADLLFVDPPYNLNKTFNGRAFKKTTMDAYASKLEEWLVPLAGTLKSTASIYICSDWRCSMAVQMVAEKHFHVRNRITWEREKGRGAKSNWKNCLEDIWFCTVSGDYTFNVDAVKLRRKVIAPYTENGDPKDWTKANTGNYRLTHPPNLWTDVTVPFWSMPENTDHPTQKPEKLLAKIILASSNAGDVVLDPFLGSGTTSVVAKKLGRRFVGIEIDETYCCLAEKRLHLAESEKSIQGFYDGVFWERNTLNERKHGNSSGAKQDEAEEQRRLFC